MVIIEALRSARRSAIRNEWPLDRSRFGMSNTALTELRMRSGHLWVDPKAPIENAFCGIPIVVDHDMPDNAIEIATVDGRGEPLDRIRIEEAC